MAYSVSVTNTGGAAATGVTMSDTITSLVPGNGATAPFTTSTGSCSYDSTTFVVTCTAASLAAGQVRSITITAQETDAAGTTVPNTPP